MSKLNEIPTLLELYASIPGHISIGGEGYEERKKLVDSGQLDDILECLQPIAKPPFLEVESPRLLNAEEIRALWEQMFYRGWLFIYKQNRSIGEWWHNAPLRFYISVNPVFHWKR